MRMFFTARLDTAKTNEMFKAGKVGPAMESILTELKPEAAYFVAEGGQRVAHMVINVDDPAQLPAIAEPWFLAFEAEVELTPAFTPEEMPGALGAVEEAVAKYA